MSDPHPERAVASPGPGVDALSEGMRVGRNSLLLGAGELVGLALGFLTTILVTDRTGSDYGLLIGAQRYVALFMVLVQFGLYPLLVRSFAAARTDAGELLGSVLLVRGLIALGLAAAVPAIAWSTGYLAGELWLVLAWLLIETLGVVAETYMAMCEGLERMGRSAAIAIARSIAVFAAVVGVTWIGGGLAEYVLAYVFARTVQVAVAIYVGHSALPGLSLRFRLSRVGRLVVEARWYAAMGFSAAVHGSLPVLVLSRLAGPGETALFGAALNFLDVVMVLPLLIQRALLPAFARLAESGGAAAVANHGLRLIPLGLIPAAVGLYVLARPIVRLYPSGSFDAAAPVLATIALWLLVIGPGNVSGAFLTGLGRMRELVLANGLGVVLHAAGQLWLVPRYGAVGAAAATGVSYAVVGAICLALSLASGVILPWAAWGRTVLASLLMGAAIWPLRDAPLALPVLVGLVVYLTALAVLLPRDSLERRLARELVPRAASLR